MTADLALVPKSSNVSIAMPNLPTTAEIEAMNAMCKIAAYSGFLNSTAQMANTTQRAADAFFVMMYGRELGIPAMTALKTIYVIDGKPSCSGQALLALMRKGGMEVDVPDPGTVTSSATVKVKRPGGKEKSYTYTMDMAKKAGLENKQNWKRSPAEMLIWRAVSTACRFEAPDIVGGLYTIEELQPDRAVNEQGDPLDNIAFSTTVNESPAPVIAPEPSVKIEAIENELRSLETPGTSSFDDPEPVVEPDTDGLFMEVMRAHKVKYIQNGSKYVLFDTEQPSRLYGRDLLRNLGVEWAAFADGLVPDKQDQEPIALPAPLIVTAESKSNYWLVTKLEIAGGETS
jgi:hypothetical protein